MLRRLTIWFLIAISLVTCSARKGGAVVESHRGLIANPWSRGESAEYFWSKPEGASEVYSSMAPITDAVYHARGGRSPGLPGAAAVAGGRSDIHFCVDANGELYILSKSDGVIRTVVGASSK